jgi:hypothetical protein
MREMGNAYKILVITTKGKIPLEKKLVLDDKIT